jgi:hypothetical protein
LNSDKVRELFETLHDGHSVEINGSNERGQLTEEARSAYFKLYSVFADFAYRVA